MPGKTIRRPRSSLGDALASMRPQRNAGKTVVGASSKVESVPRFNEAPAKCRGKTSGGICAVESSRRFNEAPAKCRGKLPRGLRDGHFLSFASMRPQRNAGENGGKEARMLPEALSFNEAPAKCRGKPTYLGYVRSPASSFNEAPAKCRGKRCCRRREKKMDYSSASMRPQRNAGENLLQ